MKADYKKIVDITSIGYGDHKVTVMYYGKEIFALYNCKYIFDTYNSKKRGWKVAGNKLYEHVVWCYKELSADN